MIGKLSDFINRLSLRGKLLLVTMAVAGFAILVASSAFVAFQWYSFREVTVARQADQLNLVAKNVTASITFDDALDAREVLSSFAVIKSITNVWLYDKNNRLFAAWQRDPEKNEPVPECPDYSGHCFLQGTLLSVKPIVLESGMHKSYLGTLVVRSNMDELKRYLSQNILAVVAMMVITFLLTWFLSNRLRGIILKSIENLSTTMRQITEKRDYSQRAQVWGDDELSLMTGYFNDMLTEIESRDLLLHENVASLEAREQELNELRNYLENVINSMPSVLVGIDPKGEVTQWNFEAEKVSGIKKNEAVGRTLDDLLPEFQAEMADIRETIARREVKTSNKVVQGRDGEVKYSDITIYPLVANGVSGAVVRVDDVTEKVRLENMMVQTEKMMSVGGLAAGMAHEINNPLGIMMQACQNIVRRLSPDLKANQRVADELEIPIDKVLKYCEKRNILIMVNDISEAGERAARIVANMLQFSRGGEARFEAADLSELLDKSIELAANDYDLKKKYDFRHIEIAREYDVNLPLISVVKTEIEQVFLNLLKNSAQALASADTDTKSQIALRVTTENDFLRVEVQDNGPGMPDAVRKRVFEPFFTTKPPGLGTGLGLSVSYMIVTNNHKGTIEVETPLAGGTRFILRLPILD